MFAPQIKDLQAETVVALEMHGPFAQIPQALGRLYEWTMEHGYTPQGMPETVYLTDPMTTPEPDAAWEVWTPVKGEPAPMAPDPEGFTVKRIPVRHMASAVHKGPYESVGDTWDALMKWMHDAGIEPAGPPVESYLNDPGTVAPEEYLTELRVPVHTTAH